VRSGSAVLNVAEVAHISNSNFTQQAIQLPGLARSDVMLPSTIMMQDKEQLQLADSCSAHLRLSQRKPLITRFCMAQWLRTVSYTVPSPLFTLCKLHLQLAEQGDLCSQRACAHAQSDVQQGTSLCCFAAARACMHTHVLHAHTCTVCTQCYPCGCREPTAGPITKWPPHSIYQDLLTSRNRYAAAGIWL
jgi:hypothetical protein